MGPWLPWTGSSFCDASHRAEVEAFFRGRVDKLVGAQRPLAEALELIDQCVALKADQSAAVGEVLAAYQERGRRGSDSREPGVAG